MLKSYNTNFKHAICFLTLSYNFFKTQSYAMRGEYFEAEIITYKNHIFHFTKKMNV